jgi:hypothetical protein
VQAASEWLYILPWGIQKTINYIARKYGNPIIYVTENGRASMLLTFRWCIFILRMNGEFQLLINYDNQYNISLGIGTFKFLIHMRHICLHEYIILTKQIAKINTTNQ